MRILLITLTIYLSSVSYVFADALINSSEAESLKKDFLIQDLMKDDWVEFSSKKSSKADGLNIIFKYPKNWQAKDGDRPHIIQKVMGDSVESIRPLCMLIVGSIPDEVMKTLNTADMKEAWKEVLQEISKTVLPNNAINLGRGETKIDGEFAVWQKYKVESQRAGLEFSQYGLQYLTFYEKYFLGLQCGCGGNINIEKEVQTTFNQYLPLFIRIGNSLIIQNKWEDKNFYGNLMDNSPGLSEWLEKDDNSQTLKKNVSTTNWTAILFDLIFTWTIGLMPPLLIRHVFMRRSLSHKAALIFVSTLYLLNLVFFVVIGSQSKTHAALFLIATASFYILRRGDNSKPIIIQQEMKDRSWASIIHGWFARRCTNFSNKIKSFVHQLNIYQRFIVGGTFLILVFLFVKGQVSYYEDWKWWSVAVLLIGIVEYYLFRSKH